MCATVPTIPVVLMVPLTDLSAAMAMVPVPVAVVVTGGVPSAPISFTFRSAANDAPQNAMRPAAATSARTWTLLTGLLTMGSLPNGFGYWGDYKAKPAKERLRLFLGGTARRCPLRLGRLSLRRSLSSLPRLHLRIVVPDDATDRRARDGMMTRHMAHDTAHRSALQTALRSTQMGQECHRHDNYQTQA